ncbi:MAG: hypothetical protein ABIS30_11360, partial [Gallionella sp.]
KLSGYGTAAGFSVGLSSGVGNMASSMISRKIQSSPKCKARKKIRRAAYGLYVSKKFFMQRSITSHLADVFWRLGGMASSSISWDEI